MKRAVKESESERVRLMQQFKDDEIFRETSETMNKLWKEYIELKKGILSDNNLKIQEYTYDKHIKNSVGEMQVRKIRSTDLQKITNSMLQSGLKPRTAQLVRDYLRPFFNHLIDEKKVLKDNPARLVKVPKYDNKRYFVIDAQKAQLLFLVILEYHDPLYRGIFIFLLHGRRLNEVLSLEWQHIDDERDIYTIESANNKTRRSMIDHNAGITPCKSRA